MARKGYRDKLIRNYYENRDSIMVQKLGEIVSELWLAPDEFAKRRLWERAAKALRNLGVKEDEITRLVNSRDEKALARFLEKQF